MEGRYNNPSEINGGHNAEDEIDLLELAKKLWAGRKLIFRNCGIAAVLAIVVGFSIPKEYTSSAILSPEASGLKGVSRSLGQLAGMMGFNVGSSNSSDAVYPLLYPDVVNSVPFITDLFTLEVTDRKGELNTTLYDYVLEHTRRPWWNVVISAPFKAVGWFISLFRDETEVDQTQVDTFRLTKEQTRVMKAISKRISVMVDKKTMVVSLAVTMQDPMVSAIVADAVIENLKVYITDYRTSKSRNDLEFAEQFYDEARENYERQQSIYADYVDRNQNIVLQRVRVEQERLQYEMQLRYEVYNQAAQQLQLAKAKVQESTPVYAVIQPVTVPLKSSKPSKMMILVGFIFLAGAGSAAWILFCRDIVAKLKEDKNTAE